MKIHVVVLLLNIVQMGIVLCLFAFNDKSELYYLILEGYHML
jgi:hypothetical protein